jgi:hypothetical protein
MVSLINPCKGEVFYDSRVAQDVSEALTKEGYLVENPSELSERDLGRRLHAYLASYFLPLRREALSGFSSEMQLKILDRATACLKSKFPDRASQQQWKHQIAKDRSWVQGEMEV